MLNFSQQLTKRRQWWILAAMSTCLALSFIDMTAIAVSLPQIQKLLQASSIQLQWIVNAYLLTLGVFIIAAGRMGDIYGYKQIFLLGVFIFLLASITSALAPDIKFLIASRALQGFGAALFVPNSSTIMLNTFPVKERGKAMGIYVGIASVFLATGPFIGGVLTQLVNWRLIFWINIPLTIFSMVIVTFFLPEIKTLRQKNLDLPGIITLGIAISSLIYGLMEGSILGWQSPLIIFLFSLALISFCFFIWFEKKTKTPLVDFSIFKNKVYRSCLVAIFCIQIALVTGVFRAIWFQDVLAFRPAVAGILILPGTAPILFISPLAGRLVDKYGVKIPASLGFILSIIGMIFTAYIMQYQNYWWLFSGILLLGIGMPLAVTPIMTTGLSVIEHNKRGMGAGMLHATRQLGGTFGLAVLGAIITTVNLSLMSQYLLRSLPFLQPKQIEGLLVNAPESQLALHSLTPQELEQLHLTAKAAYTFAFSRASYVAAIFLLLGLVAILLSGKYKLKD